MAKNVRFWPFYLVFSYSTVTTTLLMLQNVSYHHTEQLFQTWSPHRCLIGLIIAKNGPKNGQNRLFLAILSWLFLINCTHKSSSVVKCQLLSHRALFTNMECPYMLQRACNRKKIAQKLQEMAKTSHFWSFMGHFFAIISPVRHI